MDEQALRQLRHDLRSPLVVITGFAQLMAGERPISDEDRRDYSARIIKAAEEMESLMSAALG